MTVGDLIDKLRELDHMLTVNVVVGFKTATLTDVESYPDEVNLFGKEDV